MNSATFSSILLTEAAFESRNRTTMSAVPLAGTSPCKGPAWKCSQSSGISRLNSNGMGTLHSRVNRRSCILPTSHAPKLISEGNLDLFTVG